MHEAHCARCGYWYPFPGEWAFDEVEVRQGGGERLIVLQTADCPGCGARHDETSIAVRERSA